MDRLPNFLIVGVPKAGTSAIFAWLADHPQALGSTAKETCFFADPGTHVFRQDFNTARGLDNYRTAFPVPNAQTRMIFEATPSYIYSKTALSAVPDLPTQPKCLVVLREPASQIQSLFTYFQNNWGYIPADMSFETYIDILLSGSQSFGGNELARDALTNAVYLPWLRRWRDRLGPDRMKVVTFDRLTSAPADLMSDISVWCGLDPAFYESYGFPKENESYVPKNRTLQNLNIAIRERLPKGVIYDFGRRLYRKLNTRKPESTPRSVTISKLRQRFAADNAQLAQEFDLDLTGWGL